MDDSEGLTEALRPHLTPGEPPANGALPGWLSDLIARSEEGEVGNEREIGGYFLHGLDNVRSDPSAGEAWMLKAITLGDLKALTELGLACLDGPESLRDGPRAIALLRHAASRGERGAQLEWGQCLVNGQHVARDAARGCALVHAIASSTDAADAHLVAHAAFLVGFCHELGEGVPADLLLAFQWYSYAAAKGSKHAARALAQNPALARAGAQGGIDLRRWRMVFLAEDWRALGLGHDAEPALARLAAADRAAACFSFGLDGVIGYDWDRQIITLTATASEALVRALPGDAGRDPGLLAVAEMNRSLGWADPVRAALSHRAFVVLFDQQFLYGGIFLPPESNMAIHFPVARIRQHRDRVVIALLPMHVPFAVSDPVVGEHRPLEDRFATPDGQGLPPEVTQAFARLAVSEQAQRLRAVVRDPTVRAYLDFTGRLRATVAVT